MAKVYTIDPGPTQPKDFPLLVGLQIIDLGNNQYELVQVLQTVAGNNGPQNLPVFSLTSLKGTNWNWTVTANSKTEGTNRSMSGSWSNTDNQTSFKNEEGTWTASGTGTGTDEDEAQAASASY